MMVYSASLLDNAIENKQSVYYMELVDIEDGFLKTEEENINSNIERSESIKKLRDAECVEAVYTYYGMSALSNEGDTHHNIGVYDSESVAIFPEPYRGSWFTEPVDDEGCFNAVVYGSQYENIEIGSIITAYAEGREIKFKIRGEIYESLPIPNYNGSGSSATANMIYSNENSGIVVFECDESMKYVLESARSKAGLQNERFIIEFTENATDADIKVVLDKLAKYGGFSYMEDLIENSKESSQSIFKVKMTIPIFYTVIAFCAFLCITVLYVIRRTGELAVYHLLGYSKVRIASSMVLRVVFLISSAAMLNIAYVENYYNLLAKGIVDLDARPPYFDTTSSLIILAISSAMLVIALVAAICTLRSRAPIVLQRISKE